MAEPAFGFSGQKLLDFVFASWDHDGMTMLLLFLESIFQDPSAQPLTAHDAPLLVCHKYQHVGGGLSPFCAFQPGEVTSVYPETWNLALVVVAEAWDAPHPLPSVDQRLASTSGGLPIPLRLAYTLKADLYP